MDETKAEYDEDFLKEIHDWLETGKHPSGSEPDRWADNSLKYCLSLITQLKDENDSLWFMLEEMKNSRWTQEHSDELSKTISEHLSMLKLMQLRKGEA